MKPDRLNAFTDGVIAIIITIMVLELRMPVADVAALQPVLPLFAATRCPSSMSASTGTTTIICCSRRGG